ncbi:1855_t:CDS:1, partial [Gigaspora rosea]
MPSSKQYFVKISTHKFWRCEKDDPMFPDDLKTSYSISTRMNLFFVAPFPINNL